MMTTFRNVCKVVNCNKKCDQSGSNGLAFWRSFRLRRCESTSVLRHTYTSCPVISVPLLATDLYDLTQSYIIMAFKIFVW